MLYPKCPTCKTILANKQLLYEAKMTKICGEDLDEETMKKKKMEVHEEIGLKNYCCKMRMMSYVKKVELIM